MFLHSREYSAGVWHLLRKATGKNSQNTVSYAIRTISRMPEGPATAGCETASGGKRQKKIKILLFFRHQT